MADHDIEQTVDSLTPPRPETPELTKMGKQKKILKMQHIGVFLEWLEASGYHIAVWTQFDEIRDPMLTVSGKSINELLAEYAGIDLKIVDQEQRALLQWWREVQGL
jgi:hypothetical protein